MKRFVIVLLALALLCSGALAETRQREVLREGEPETLVETRWQGDLGFSLWYDAEGLAVDDTMGEAGGSLILFPAEYDLPVYLEILTPEAAGELPWKFLELHADPDTEYQTVETDSGAQIHWFYRFADERPGIVEGYYAVETDETFVVAESSWPEEVAEGWGELLWLALSSIEFDAAGLD